MFEGMHVTKNKDGSILLVPLKSEQPVSSAPAEMTERVKVEEKPPRREGHSSDASEEPPRKTLRIERNADGSLKVERTVKSEPPPAKPPADDADEPTTTIADLDPHSRAAIEALNLRNAKKKSRCEKKTCQCQGRGKRR